MRYNIISDLKILKTLLRINNSTLASKLNVARSTISRIMNGDTYPSDMFLETLYSFAYSNDIHNIRLNALKSQINLDNYELVLFHGGRGELDNIDLSHSRKDIDLGCGFYLGESYEQAASYIYHKDKASVYVFNATELLSLKFKKFKVDLEWMLAVAYFRGYLNEYKDSKKLSSIIGEIDRCDVIIAPIADNNMYDIMNQFARGLISDKQAIAALSASHLGMQYVLKTQRACDSIKMLDRLYLAKEERKDIEKVRKENANISNDKAKVAIEQNRRVGKYVEELFK